VTKKPETSFKEKCFDDFMDLKAAGGMLWWVKIQQVAIHGTPDVMLCINGTFWAMELKKDSKEKPSKIQKYTLDQIKRAGGITSVESPETWPKTLHTVKTLAFGGVGAQ
jgi:hypothetical protein